MLDPAPSISTRLIQLSKSRRVLSLVAVCTLIFLTFTSLNHYRPGKPWTPDPRTVEFLQKHNALTAPSAWQWNSQRDRRSFILDQTQCSIAFPDLYKEIDRAVSARNGKKITIHELDAIPYRNGMVRAMIYDQQLYVVAKDGEIYSRSIALLLALNRAITSSPEPLPNVEFMFCVDDGLAPEAKHVAEWSLARKKNNQMAWLIPDFTSWSWPETKAGSFGEVQEKAIEMEETTSNPSSKMWTWENKIPKTLWRGALMNIDLRHKLVEITEGKSWADVKELHWKDKESTDADLKTLAEHCQYKFPINVAGVTYSGRLKYIQNCHSVILMHEDDWVTIYTHLMINSGPNQNFVELKRDLSDLGSMMEFLIDNDETAEVIADNNVAQFRDRYLTPAAEACYWRRLIRSWAAISDFEPELYKKDANGKKVWRGVPVESYVLERRLEWDPY